MVSSALTLAKLSVSTAEAAIGALAHLLVAQGHVTEGFSVAAIARERRSPTGLPFSPHAVALPHAEPEHVVSPAVAIATLAAPVRFRQMGSPALQLGVSLVVMPALTTKEQASAQLARIIELLQSEDLRSALVGADDPNEISRLFEEKWNG